MFNFDPDDLIEGIEKQENYDTGDLIADIESEINYDPNDLIDDVIEGTGFEAEEVEINDSIVEEAIIAGAIFGMGIEEGQAKEGKAYPKGERSPGAVSLRNLERSAGRRKLRPFEQWVDDVVHGRKTLDDAL